MSWPGEIRHFVLLVSQLREPRPRLFVKPRLPLDIQLHLALRKFHPQRRVLLKRQAISREMIRREGHRGVDIRHPARLILSWQGKH